MDPGARATEINERLSQERVPAEDLRTQVRGGKLVLTGSYVMRLPEGRRTIRPQEPERTDPEPWAEFDSEEGLLEVVSNFLRTWPYV